jgi:hypothetical protein
MTSSADLPLPDYDDLTLPDLTHRVRTLDAADLEAVIAYEEQHGNRLPVLEVLRARAGQLEQGGQPSGGPSGGPAHTTPTPDGGSGVSPQTSGPPVNPPSHGDPTNPAQPRG